MKWPTQSPDMNMKVLAKKHMKNENKEEQNK